MDVNLLRSWVGLAPGPWPPADRELLGLQTDGPVEPAAVEAAALDRMARLRTHQLVHPDLVTEGMNRVAQAMMAVTASHAPRRSRPATPPSSVSTIQPTPPISTQVDRSHVESAHLPAFPSTATLNVPQPPVLVAVPVADEPPIAAVAPVSAFQRRSLVEPIRIPVDVPPPPGLVLDEGEIPPHGRRAAYRELAGLRAMLRAFDQLRASVALPGEGLLSPAAVCDLLEAISTFRTASMHPGLEPAFVRTVAPNLSTLLFQPLPLAMFRSLTRTQRTAFAREWAGGRAGVQARMEALRSGLERPRRADPFADLGRWGRRVFAAQPELLLIAATVLVALVATVRAVAR